MSSEPRITLVAQMERDGLDVPPRAYCARASAPVVGLLGFAKGAGDDKGRLYGVVVCG